MKLLRKLLPLVLLATSAHAGLVMLGSQGHQQVQSGGGGGGSAPSWFTSQTSKTWHAVATTGSQIADVDPCPPDNCAYSGNEGQNAVTDDWVGAAASPTSLIIAAQGGHMGYAGNEVYVLDLTAESPAWAREVDPSTSVQQEVGYYADGKPSSRHGYAQMTYIPDSVIAGGRFYQPLGYAVWGNGGTNTSAAVGYRPGSGAYDAQGAYSNFPGSIGSEAVVAWDAASSLAWVKEANDSVAGGLYSYDPSTDTWSSRFGSWARVQGDTNGAIDPTRHCFVILDGTQVFSLDLDSPATNPVTLTPTGTGPTDNGPGFIYDPVGGVFLAWQGGATVYMLTPGASCANSGWAWSTLTNAGGGDTPTAANLNGTFGRFNYISQLHALVVVNATVQSTYVYKLPTAGNYN